MCGGYVHSAYDPPRVPGPGERLVRVAAEPGSGVRLTVDGPQMPARENIVFSVAGARELAAELRHRARQEAWSAARGRRRRLLRLLRSRNAR